MATANVNSRRKIGRFGLGWQFVRSAWRVLQLDKELAGLPVLGFITTIVVFGILGGLGFAAFASGLLHTADFNSSSQFSQSPLSKVVYAASLLLFYFIVGMIANLFTGALFYGAIQRFRGGDPTIRSSLGGAWRKFGPLALFTLVMSTVSLIVRLLEERFSFVGDLIVQAIGGAWSIANVFSIPVIILSDKRVGPIEATKQSVAIIKKVWGNGVVANLGLGLVMLLAYVTYIGTFVGGVIAVNRFTSVSPAVAIPVIVVAVLGLIVMTIVFSVLSTITKAALYHYATTGQSPENFNAELLRAAMTPKKARRIFG